MRLDGHMKKFYYLCLLAIFTYAMTLSFLRLLDRKISMVHETKTIKVSLYPSVTMCPVYNMQRNTNLSVDYAQLPSIHKSFYGLNHSYTVNGR